MKLKHVSAKNLTKSMELIKVKRFKYALGNIHFFAIFGDTYLPMYYVRFFLTYLPTQKLDILYGHPLMNLSQLFGFSNLSCPSNSVIVRQEVHPMSFAGADIYFTLDIYWPILNSFFW